MENHPDICVWFEINSMFVSESDLQSYSYVQDAKKENDKVITNSQSDQKTRSEDVAFLEIEDSYFFRIHPTIRLNCFVFPFFSNGWQNFPYRVFLEINPKIKMGIISFNGADLFGQLEVFNSKGKKQTSILSYSITPMFAGSLCLIEGKLYRADFYCEDPYIFFTLAPL